MRAIAVLVALAAAAGCASTPEQERDRPTGWGGIVEEKPPPPPPLTGRLSVPTPSVRPYPVKEWGAEEQAFFETAWAAFRRGDRGWPELRERWRSLGPEATGLLAENLYRAMVASRVRGALHLVAVAKKELEYLGGDSVPVLVGGLSVRAVKNAEGEEVVVGQEVLHDAAEALSIVGAPAVPGLLDVATSGEPVLVREAIWALGNIGDPRSEEALLAHAAAPDLLVRSAAILALRNYRTPRARAVLVAGLEDADPLVIERAAESLARGGHREAAPAVVDALERAQRDARPLPSSACVWVLQKLTGETIEADPAAWRRALAGR
jgi:hypothetical protein